MRGGKGGEGERERERRRERRDKEKQRERQDSKNRSKYNIAASNCSVYSPKVLNILHYEQQPGFVVGAGSLLTVRASSLRGIWLCLATSNILCIKNFIPSSEKCKNWVSVVEGTGGR